MIDVDYPALLKLFPQHLAEGRSESASFLIWYLENYYRLDSVEAVYVTCDQRGDKGVDGIFVNDDEQTITIIQVQISQRVGRTVGDSGLRELVGTMSQFKDADAIKSLIASAPNSSVARLASRLNLVPKIETHQLVGQYVANINIDQNGINFLKNSDVPVEFVGKDDIVANYISDAREIPDRPSVTFSISGFPAAEYIVDADRKALIAPIQARELVTMSGITDQSLFAYNVRGPLDRSAVNREIADSVRDKGRHKMFPLFHNGVTVIAREVESNDEEVIVSGYNVVNGCQSLTTLHRNRDKITDDLRILVKFIRMDPSSDLATDITNFSNNQNGVRPRDFKANTSIQIRLQNEVSKLYAGQYVYAIKRGEEVGHGDVISNEDAGLYIRAFDLKEPWTTHRKYEIFEDKHAEIFGRPSVNADRKVLLHVIMEVIQAAIPNLVNDIVGKYVLTRYCILYMVREILETDRMIESISADPGMFVRRAEDRDRFRACVGTLVSDIVGDLNDELKEQGPDFDYRDKMRDAEWIKRVTRTSVADHRRLVQRGKMESFMDLWKNGGG